MSLKYVLFDLDGTIVDTFRGVTTSVAYSLNKFGIRVEDLESLRPFIGPPLEESFSEFCGFQGEDVKHAIEYYREFYREEGWKNCDLYEGMRELLRHLKEKEMKVLLATSKPELFAEKILEYFDIDQYFDVIAGADLEGKRSKKLDVMKYSISQIENLNVEEAVMVGDRKYDKIGSDGMGMRCILIEYGFGEHEELIKCEPFAIVPTVKDLQNFLDSI